MDRPHAPDEFISNAGWALIWIDAILFVPAIFGVMFLPAMVRLLVVGAAIAFAAACGFLYSWAVKRGLVSR
jgi:hypothetical protein